MLILFLNAKNSNYFLNFINFLCLFVFSNESKLCHLQKKFTVYLGSAENQQQIDYQKIKPFNSELDARFLIVNKKKPCIPYFFMSEIKGNFFCQALNNPLSCLSLSMYPYTSSKKILRN
jgi:hypothetical protein